MLPRFSRSMIPALVLCCAAALAGCGQRNNPPNPEPRYARLEPKNPPAFLKGTIFEYTDMAATEPAHFSGFGLVVNLRGTGDSTAPMAVRQFMIRQMVKHGFGTRRIPGYENQHPEEILRDSRVAIVRVDGLIPPGARVGQRFDVHVSALPQSRTTSLARGQLYRTDLRIDGANEMNPGGSVNVYARAEGPVFVNPAYALVDAEQQQDLPASVRHGIVMDGGVSTTDLPLVLRLLQPERRMARAIERRIDERFQRSNVAAAQDEGAIYLYVPEEYRGDWQHFAGVVSHLYLEDSPHFVAAKAQELVEEAQKPNAPLLNISYCWEGLGPRALPIITPLMRHESPEVAFAAARAAAFLGDSDARTVLAEMAWAAEHPFQLPAVQVLGSLPHSPAIAETLRRLLDSEQTMVRVEAYRVLARNRDPHIFSKVINEKFVLDIVPSQGAPLVYATQRGIPRIAVFGEATKLDLPILFTAFDKTLSISSNEKERFVTIFYRGGSVSRPVKVLSRPDLAEIIARLGGEGAVERDRLDFSYGDIVAMLQAMSDTGKLTGERRGTPAAVAFVLQELSDFDEALFTAPAIPDRSRPQSDEPPQIGLNLE